MRGAAWVMKISIGLLGDSDAGSTKSIKDEKKKSLSRSFSHSTSLYHLEKEALVVFTAA